MEALGLLREVESFLLMMPVSEKSPYQTYSMKQCTSLASQGNLFVNGFDLRQQNPVCTPNKLAAVYLALGLFFRIQVQTLTVTLV